MGEDRSYSHATAANDFGYDPISFEEGIEQEVKQYLQKNVAVKTSYKMGSDRGI